MFPIRRVRHSRMFLAGIQAELGLDPRLIHSAVTLLKVVFVSTSALFCKGGHEVRKGSFLTFVFLLVSKVSNVIASLGE
jgi:hypothetical protein